MLSAPGGMSIFREVIVSVILSKHLYIYMCPLPNGFRDTVFYCTIVITSIKGSQDALRRVTRHILPRAAKCFHVDGGILENALY
jgi:hypothetical protein